MRETPSITSLILLSLALLAPAASAHPLKPAHTAARPADRAAARTKEPAKAELRHTARIEPMPRGSLHRIEPRHAPDREPVGRKPALREPVGREPARREPAGREPISRNPATRRTAYTRAEEREERSVARPRAEQTRPNDRPPVQPARAERRPEPPAPVADVVQLPPIEVHHNRKIHLTPETAAPAGDDAAPVTGSPSATPAPPADAPAPAPALKHPASLVERNLPTLRPATVVVPDPVVEPILYTSRGHLIVPPAMKGSTEILRHQNEMADRDGLIRVQDDDDLDRLRASRQLVALPASPALEVDERLPLNRRYCRPWTAQFLAAVARAHYARFHSPLQVNSAVRTVAFQERLRFTNGNAAPAEGETASPHLTGQAIDLAKHGLSMTEIAWLRGYLMPLVQQGKVDVEEEFQQSCFHISVYKKYMPQPTPRREIPTRRTPATALAAAIR